MDVQSESETDENPMDFMANEYYDTDSSKDLNAFGAFEKHNLTPAELKRSLHGNIYQLKILLLCLWRGIKKKKNFGLITEMMEAEKFDDCIIPYIYNNKNRMQFVQAKHSQDNRPLTYANLANNKGGDFSLVKYFNSFRRIEDNPLFNLFVKSYILMTNRSVEKVKSVLKIVPINDTFFYSNEKEFEGYRINITEEHEMFKLLESQDDLNMLAEALLSIIVNNDDSKQKNNITLENEVFSIYHVALFEKNILHKIKDNECRFHKNFINNIENLSPPARKLRSLLVEKLKTSKKFSKTILTQKQIPDSFLKSYKYVQAENNLKAEQKEENVKAVASALAQLLNNEAPTVVENNSIDLSEVIDQEKLKMTMFSSKSKKYIKIFGETLLKKCFAYDDLGLLEFKLANPIFQSCFEDREVKSDLPSDNINIKDKIWTFLNNFILVISPNETVLSKIIKKEVSTSQNINLLDSDFITNHTLVKVLNWMKRKKSTLYKREEAEKLFETLHIKISNLMLAGNNSDYCKKLQEYFPIKTRTFQNSLGSRISNFLESNSFILFLTSDGPLCTLAVKVEESLREIETKSIKEFTLTNKDSFVFNPLSSILRLQDDVMNILNRPKQKTFLIVVCDDDSKNCQQILNKVNECNKIMFIGTINSAILTALKANHCFKTYNDKRNSFSHLTDEAKNFLLHKNVKFYGHNACLKEMFDLEAANDMIDSDMFKKLVCDDDIKITKKRDCYDRFDISYYVSRKFQQFIEIQESIIHKFKHLTTDALVIEQNKSNIPFSKNVVTVKHEEAEAKYLELCKNYKNVHWLKKEFNKILWVKSQGTITKLVIHQQGYSDDENKINQTSINSRSYSEEEIEEIINEKKFTILSNVAGMGKSTITSKISQIFQSMNFLVVRINFTDHSSILPCIKFDENKNALNLENMDKEKWKNGKKLIELILCLENVTQKNETFEKKLFRHFFKSGRLVIMFDGFDEIEENLKEVVLKFIGKLKSSTKNKIWITTRPAFKESLEITFGVFALMLMPFSGDDQLQFLKRYWKSKYLEMIETSLTSTFEKNVNADDRIHTYADHFLAIFKDSIHEKNRSFIGIPLQLEMLAEIYKKNRNNDNWEGCFDYINKVTEGYPIMPAAINLLKLYEQFVEIKIRDRYYYDKTGIQKSNRTLNSLVEDGLHKAIQYHKLFALVLLITEKKFKSELLDSKKNELEKWSQKIKSGEESAGIITDIVDGHPHFVHRTFAEYFAAVYLIENCFQSRDNFFLYVNNICGNCSTVFLFCVIELLKNEKEFQVLLQGKNLLTYAAEKGYLNIVKTLKKEHMVSDCDNNGKTSLHYAAENNRKEVVAFLLEFHDDIHKKNILRNGTLKKSEYESSKLVCYVNKNDNMKNTALYYAIKKKNWDIAEHLALKGDACELSERNIKKLSKHIVDKITTMITSDRYWNVAKPLCMESRSSIFERHGNFRTFAPAKHYLYPILEKMLPNIDVNQLSPEVFNRLIAILWYRGRLQLIRDIENTVNNTDFKKNIFKAIDRKKYPLDRINESPHISDDERLELIRYLFQHDGISISKLSPAHTMLQSPENPHFTALLNSAVEHGAIKTFKHYFHEKKDLADNFLYLALSYHEQEIVEYLLQNWNQEINHNTPLHIAMFNDSVSVKHLDKIYEQTKEILEMKNERTPLLMAVYSTHGLPKIKYLVEKNENMIAEHQEQIISALNKNPYDLEDDILKYLLKKIGCDFNQTLHEVMKHEIEFYGISLEEQKQRRLEIISRIVHEEYDLIQEQKTSNTALMIYLIKHGAEVNERNNSNKIPMHYACEAQFEHVINVLLQHGSKYEDESGEINIHSLEKIRKAFKDTKSYAGVLPFEFINAKNKEDKTLLHIALENSSNDALEDILIAHEDHLKSRNMGTKRYKYYSFIALNGKDKYGKTPLMIAMKNKNYWAIKQLVQCGVIFDIENFHSGDKDIDQLVYNVATLFNNIKKTSKIFNVSDDLKDVRNKNGETPLHCAIKFKRYDILLSLIKMNAYIEAQNNDHKTPLYFAAKMDDFDAVNMLLLNGALLDTANIFQHPNTHSEKQLNEISKIFDILKGKCPENIIAVLNKRSSKEVLTIVNACDEHGHTLLHYAGLWNYIDIILYLIENGSVVNNVAKCECAAAEKFDNKAHKKLFKNISKLYDDLLYFAENLKMLEKENGLDKNFVLKIRKHIEFEEVIYKGSTLLHAAVHFMQIDVIKWLLLNGADINAHDFEGNTVKQLKSYQDNIKVRTCIDSFST